MSAFAVVRPNSRRRHGIARNMAAAGWPRWAICLSLGLKHHRLDAILSGSAIWGVDTEKLKAAVRDYERLAA